MTDKNNEIRRGSSRIDPGAAGAGDVPPSTETAPATLPDTFPLEAAQNWIGRWKDAGGGFFCHIVAGDQIMVQLAFSHERYPDEQSAIDAAQPLQNEILADPELKTAVCTLVANTWANAQKLAQPQGNA